MRWSLLGIGSPAQPGSWLLDVSSGSLSGGDALELVKVRLIDHFVVGDGEVVLFAERGWL